MDSTLKYFLDQGKALIKDTKTPRQKPTKTKEMKSPGGLEAKVESDPHKRFSNSVIKDKPSKKDVVEKIQGFITQAEAEL